MAILGVTDIKEPGTQRAAQAEFMSQSGIDERSWSSPQQSDGVSQPSFSTVSFEIALAWAAIAIWPAAGIARTSAAINTAVNKRRTTAFTYHIGTPYDKSAPVSAL